SDRFDGHEHDRRRAPRYPGRRLSGPRMVLTPRPPQDLDALTPAELVGQLLVVGFDGQRAPPELAQALRAGERAGVILFRRNLEPGLGGLGKLQDSCAELAALARSELPPLIAIDEEGGRVARLS